MVENLRKAGEKKVAVGFDGYVDSILRVRKTESEFFASLSEFGRYVQDRANKSGSLELKKLREKLGGNMPIFALALAKLGPKLSCIGALGYPEIHPAFSELAGCCEIKTVSGPGYCQALEFDDGKLMLADNEEIENLDFSLMAERAGLEYLRRTFEESDMIVLLNWSELKGSLSLWHGLEAEIFPRLSAKKRSAFIDLSDCSPRSGEDIREAVGLMKSFAARFDLTVSFNRNEAETVAKALSVTADSMETLACSLQKEIGCGKLAIHLVDCCYCASETDVYIRKNRYVAHPVLSTGGGDNFNAGFVYGLLSGMDCEGCMALANNVSGFYVSHGHSPSVEELTEWMNQENS